MHAEPRAVSVGILKGGFAKTTTALNLARELAHRNERALVVDLDDNGHMTLNLGFDDAYANTEDENQANHAEDVLLNGADPRQYVKNVADGLDIFPAHEDLEGVESGLKEAMMGTTHLKKHLVDPLLGDDYDHIVVDCPANRGKLNDNAMYGTGNLIIPLRPENGYDTGLTNTINRLVMEAREHFELNILAVTPSGLQKRIDQSTRDRDLLRELSSHENIARHVPNYAYLSEEDWNAVDNGGYDGGLPGIRHRGAIDDAMANGEPLRDYAPDCDQLPAYGELAEIVETGEVSR